MASGVVHFFADKFIRILWELSFLTAPLYIFNSSGAVLGLTFSFAELSAATISAHVNSKSVKKFTTWAQKTFRSPMFGMSAENDSQLRLERARFAITQKDANDTFPCQQTLNKLHNLHSSLAVDERTPAINHRAATKAGDMSIASASATSSLPSQPLNDERKKNYRALAEFVCKKHKSTSAMAFV